IVSGEHHRLRHWDFPFPDLLAVGVQSYCAALGEAAAGVSKLHPHLMLACGQGARGFDIEILHAAQVVAILELASLRVKAPSADVPALGDDHTFGASLRNHDFGGNRVGLVLDVHDAVLTKPTHTAEEDLCPPLD